MPQQQQQGWPLGLRLLNPNIGLVRSHDNADFSGSASFTTLLTPSLSSASRDSSSDLDTQSTGSFFHGKSSNNTLGSLIGISSIFELSRRSTRGRMVEPLRDNNKKSHKLKPWLFSLCSRLTTDAVAMNGDNVPSLGHYLQQERRAANAGTWRNRTFSYPYGVNDFSPVRDSNSLFLGDQVAAPECAAMEGEEGGREPDRALLGQSNGYGGLVVFPCLCG
ncbi:uncharacterized protein At3g17950-like isoform X1 [Neltuma alba]|uniref:uncharacterized protein At3g17950-like isoform X1 n=1 Tax=Neltuma alba TaxID=207710 RepID=UPI0010A404F9|nr:uncharacterized protein At3g17950-like isoform X1 [Prosopis alba]